MQSFLSYVFYAVFLVLMFGLTVFVHELGHFLLAKRFGMVVDAFSIGFGPAIWQRKIRGTTYKIGWIPVGGYVALPQLDPTSMSGIQGSNKEAGEPAPAAEAPEGEARPLPPLAPWKRIVVSVSGALGNVLFAVLLAWIIYLNPEAVVGESSTVIGHVSTNSVAYARGIRASDRILAVNGKEVGTWNEYIVESHLAAGGATQLVLTVASDGEIRDVELPLEKEGELQLVPGIDRSGLCVITGVLEGSAAEAAGVRTNDVIVAVESVPVTGCQHFIQLVAPRAGDELAVTVERAGKRVDLTLTPRYNEAEDRALIGVHVDAAMLVAMPWMQYRQPWAQIESDAKGIVRILQALVSPRKGEARQAAGALGGPIMILVTLWLSIESSLLNAVGFVRFLNINLGILNMLPIPVLDGGHVLFLILEVLRGKPVDERVQGIATQLGLIILLLFMTVVLVQDGVRAFTG